MASFMESIHPIFCLPLFLLPPIFPAFLSFPKNLPSHHVPEVGQLQSWLLPLFCRRVTWDANLVCRFLSCPPGRLTLGVWHQASYYAFQYAPQEIRRLWSQRKILQMPWESPAVNCLVVVVLMPAWFSLFSMVRDGWVKRWCLGMDYSPTVHFPKLQFGDGSWSQMFITHGLYQNGGRREKTTRNLCIQV